MIRTILYTLLIMLGLGTLLFAGLYGPPVGKQMVRSTIDFFQRKMPAAQEGPLSETESTIKEFNAAFRNIHALRDMVVSRNKQSTDQLEDTYKEVRENLKQLLLEMDQQSVTNRAKLLDNFTLLHAKRKDLVGKIINDERTLININEQMDSKLREISSWLTQEVLNPSEVTKDELTRSQQYANLVHDLQSFAQESNDLDVLRIVLMRKSADFVNQLEASNEKLEVNFSALSAQIAIATPDQAQGLWSDYDQFEGEQRQIVAGMKLNQQFIGENQQKITTGVATIARNISYRTDNQLERFQQNYQQLDAQRTAVLSSIEEHQRFFMDSKETMRQVRESNEYRMRQVREKADQILSQYERLEEYRRNLSSTLREMTQELRDNDQIMSQQMETMRLNIPQFEANTKSSTGFSSNVSELNQRTQDMMSRSIDQMQLLRSRMEDAHMKLDSLVRDDLPKTERFNPYLIRLDDLRNRNKASMELMQKGEDQMRNAQERQRSSIEALKDRMANLRSGVERLRAAQESQRAAAEAVQERVDDLRSRNDDAMESQKQKTQEQNRTQRERIADQMQRLKDQQQNRRN